MKNKNLLRNHQKIIENHCETIRKAFGERFMVSGPVARPCNQSALTAQAHIAWRMGKIVNNFVVFCLCFERL